MVHGVLLASSPTPAGGHVVHLYCHGHIMPKTQPPAYKILLTDPDHPTALRHVSGYHPNDGQQ